MTAGLDARFLAVISHELRTPLTTIASFAESLDNDDLAPDDRSLALSAVRRNTARMLALVDDLLLVSRLQSGDLSLHPASVDPAALIRQAAGLLTTTPALTMGEGPGLIADGPLLVDLFYAVLGTLTGGVADRPAEIHAAADGGHWRVTIRARQSPELTDEHLMAGRLADPRTPHRLRSSALWMLLADAIATRHGGSIVLTFEAGTGAGAEIRLPLTIPSG